MTMRQSGTVLTFLLGVAMVPVLPSRAADYRGAAAVLQPFTSPTAAEGPAAALLLGRDLAAFRKTAGSLPPEEAARGWLALAERYAKPGVPNVPFNGRQLEFSQVLACLPPPASWESLSLLILNKHPANQKTTAGTTWRFIAHLLAGDTAAQTADAVVLETQLARAKPGLRAVFTPYLAQLADLVARQSNDPKRILRAAELHLAQQNPNQPEQNFELPDLVTLIGPSRAEAFVRRALLTCRGEISVPVGDATRRLARNTAVELVAALKAPQWGLAQSLDGAALYTALNRRFPEGKPRPPAPGEGFEMTPRKTAAFYYMLGLAGAGKTQAAQALLPQFAAAPGFPWFPEAPFETLKETGRGKALINFLHAALSARPALPLWPEYVQSSAEEGRTAELIDLLKAILDRKGVEPGVATRLRETLLEAYLNTGQLPEGVTVLRELLRPDTQAPEGSPGGEAVTWAVRMARIGQASQRREWIAEGVAAARKAALADAEQGSDTAAPLVLLLLDLGRGPEAEALLSELLVHSAALAAAAGGVNAGSTSSCLTELLGVYHRAGRAADVLTLLDQAPGWGARDVSEISTQQDARETPLAYMAAAALAATGKKSDAIRMLESVLLLHGDYDPAYELAAQLEGEALFPLLERLRARDPFEERPLIWKAYVLFRAGRLDEAEKLARAALAIDPSDCDQPSGRRMRAYLVLADIRAAQGDPVQAKGYRERVRAIRLAEEADQLLETGLVQRAMQLYQEGLTLFPDAYCIHARLAEQLAMRGKEREAEPHFRKAYELMPQSLGGAESFCPGYEHLFRGQRQRKLAEQVFTQLAAQNPDNPRVHSLLGLVCELQNRFPDAVRHYRRAAALDPDYLAAWQRLHLLGQRLQLSPADRAAPTANLVRLDPAGRHGEIDLLDATDLRELWKAGQAAEQFQPAAGPLYRLAASAQAQDELERDHPEIMMQALQRAAMLRMQRGMGGLLLSEGGPAPSPAERVAQHRLLALAGQILDLEKQLDRGEQ